MSKSQQQHDRSQLCDWTAGHFWRTGRRVGRNIYAMVHENPDQKIDVLIGQMDTSVLAALVVANHNAALKA